MTALQQIPLYLEFPDAGPADWALLGGLAILLVWAGLSCLPVGVPDSSEKGSGRV